MIHVDLYAHLERWVMPEIRTQGRFDQLIRSESMLFELETNQTGRSQTDGQDLIPHKDKLRSDLDRVAIK